MDNKGSVIKDEELIKALTKGLDLSKPKDIETVYRSLQSGSYVFYSEVGRKFDDDIFELMEKVKSGEISDEPENTKSKKKLKVKPAVAKETKQKPVKEKKTISDKDMEILVSLELKKREKKRKLLIFLASLVAVASLGYFCVYYFMSSRTTVDYEDLAALKGSRSLSNGGFSEPIKVNKTSDETPDILAEYQTLFSKNMKLAGWLKIDGTKIDYPVMQTSDNEYYLNHNFNQQKDNNGSLFLDCECSLYPQSTNMIIYGHHMKSGNMFGNLQKYAKEDYGKEHKNIYFDTIFEKGTYEVMFVFYSKVYDNDELVFKYYQFINANSETEFNYYMDEMKKLSLYDTGVTANYGDKLLTLSTCDHSQTDGRFAVVAKKIY